MKRRWARRLLGTMLGLVLGIVVLWAAMLLFVPTGWARTRLEKALREATGHEVHVKEARLGALGEIHLQGLEICEPNRPDSPWLTADEVRVDLNILQLLTNHGEPTRVEVSGLNACVRREAGGQFPFCHLLRARPRPSHSHLGHGDGPEVAFELEGGHLTIVDELSGIELNLTDLNGHGTWKREHSRIDMLQGRIDGGPFDLAADLERSTTGPMFDVELKARHVPLTSGPQLLGFVVPVLLKPGQNSGVEGQVDFYIYLRGQGDTCPELARTLEGQGSIQVDPVQLADSGLLAELSKALTLPPNAHLASVHGPFQISKGRIVTSGMIFNVGQVPLALDGGATFDGQFDYRARSEALAELLVPDLRNLLPDLPAGVDEALDLRLIGGDGNPARLTIGGVPLNGETTVKSLNTKDLIRNVARRARDRITR